MKTLITGLIEKLLAKTKAKNGGVYLIIMLILVALFGIGQYLLDPTNITGIHLSSQVTTAINYALAVIAALIGVKEGAAPTVVDNSKQADSTSSQSNTKQ